MVKWLVGIVIVLIAVWVVLWFGTAVMNRVYSDDAENAWPMGLGPLSEVEKRYPPAPASASASVLIDRARKIEVDISPRGSVRANQVTQLPMQFRQKLATYVSDQIRKTTPEIDAPPAEIGEYLAAHAADLAAVREVLLGEEQVAWSVDFPNRRAPLPNLLGHMVLSRVLLTDALDRARRGDPAAWEDARAVVAMSRGLWERPELISSLIALAMHKSVNAVARKLPLPPPAWFAEFQNFDYKRAMIAARQVETRSVAEAVYAETTIDDEGDRGTRRLVDVLGAPYTRMATNDTIEVDRRTAIEIAETTACDIDARSMTRKRRHALAWWNLPGRALSTPNLDQVWQRVLRYRAELEATDRALRLRAGQSPIPTSACSDGTWVYSPDGFRFSKTMTKPPEPATTVPLEFSLR